MIIHERVHWCSLKAPLLPPVPPPAVQPFHVARHVSAMSTAPPPTPVRTAGVAKYI